jgi:tRNA/rRNA methyltransferase
MSESTPPPAREPALAHVVVVLVEPVEPGNVGAIARVMWNLGASQLRLVVADGARRAELVGGDARARACRGVPILESATFHDDLAGALRGIGRASAFSARTGRRRQPRASLEQVAARLAAEREASAALVFGREDRGLETHEVDLAHELVTIPAPGADPVLNLSHAVTIALWEVVRAAAAFAPLSRPPLAPRPASADDRAALRTDVSKLLVELGLSPGAWSDLHGRILHRFIDLFDRAGAEYSDFSMLQGLLVSIRRKLARRQEHPAHPAFDAPSPGGASNPADDEGWAKSDSAGVNEPRPT